MPDVFTQAKRSQVMARIRSRGNKATELALRKLFRCHGITDWRCRTVRPACLHLK
jgi:DNA mismatch endonuclease (patch repair protein)